MSAPIHRRLSRRTDCPYDTPGRVLTETSYGRTPSFGQDIGEAAPEVAGRELLRVYETYIRPPF